MTGSYQVAFWLSIFFYACGSMAFWMLRRPPPGAGWTSVELPVYFIWLAPVPGIARTSLSEMNGFARMRLARCPADLLLSFRLRDDPVRRRPIRPAMTMAGAASGANWMPMRSCKEWRGHVSSARRNGAVLAIGISPRANPLFTATAPLPSAIAEREAGSELCKPGRTHAMTFGAAGVSCSLAIPASRVRWLSLWLHRMGAEVGWVVVAAPTEPSLFALAGLDDADPDDVWRHSRS